MSVNSDKRIEGKAPVFMHDLRLALRSLRRNPVLSALMIGTIAVGIAACMIAVTLYHARAGHPIPWKNDTLFAVMLDTRDNSMDQSFSRHPEYPPWQLTYRDAQALYSSKIPLRSVEMYKSGQVLTPDRKNIKPFGVVTRVTTADFFAMFDVPFLYGGGWSRAEDEAPGAVVVLSKFTNQKLFGGANSVGREVTLDGHAYRVIGVLGAWMPQPKYYDPNNSGFDIPEDVFIPFGWMKARRLGSYGNTQCVSKDAKVEGFDTLLTQDCVWLQFWVEFRERSDRDRYQAFVDNYTNEARLHGRFLRPNNNRIVDVPTWLRMWDVVGDDSFRLQLALGFVFLGVCVLNTLGLMLAKFLSAAPISGLRRALGATRADVIRQHLIEVIVVGLLGGAAGLAVTLGGLGVPQRALLFPYRPCCRGSG